MAKTRKISMKKRAKQTRRRKHGGFLGFGKSKVAPAPNYNFGKSKVHPRPPPGK